MRPGKLFEHLAGLGTPWPGAAAVALAGATWAGLCLLLAAGGHEPSVTLLPIERDRYYLVQAAFVVPVLVAQWALCTWVATAVARPLGGRGTWRTTASPVGAALAAPLIGLFLLPDLVAYAIGGFAALGPLVRVTAPLSSAFTLVLATLAVRAAHSLGTGRSLLAGGAGVIAQAVLGGVFLR